MNHTPVWISEAVRKFKVNPNRTGGLTTEQSRLMVKGSSLLDRMHAACAAVNSQLDEGMVYEESFLQPQTCFCRYEYKVKSLAFNMDLEISPEGPMLTFWSTKPKLGTAILEQFLKRRLDSSCRLNHKLLINPFTADKADVHHWFTYLLSGFHYFFKPCETHTLSQ